MLTGLKLVGLNGDIAVCPGCGFIGNVGAVYESCPKCEWENGVEPYRLLTLDELVKDGDGIYNDICMSAFLISVIRLVLERGEFRKA